MASNITAQLPQTPDNPWKDAQFPFDGAWMPNDDPALIGPRNFAVLTNMRYKEKTIQGINGYTKFNTTPLVNYVNIKNGFNFRSDKTEKSFTLVHAVENGGQGRVYQNKSTPGTQGDFDSSARFTTAGTAYHTDRSSSLTGRFSSAPQNSMIYANGEETMIYSGTEQRCAAAFLELAAGISDISDTVNVKLDSTYCTMSDVRKPIILTTRPIQGVKFYVKNANALEATLTAEYWSGSAWVAVDSMTDNTIVAAKTMGQTGWVTFTHTESTAKPKHYQELYLYAYRFTMSTGTANIYYVTVDPAFQSIKDIWDGVFRQPIQFQVYNLAKTAYEDYTLQVNQSSDINVPIGAQLDGLVGNANPANADAIFVMFEEKMAGIRMTMLGALLNAVSSTMTVYYWNGATWTDIGATDGTAVGAITLAKTGTISWTPPTAEEKTTLFGSLGFAYKIQFTATLTGTKASTAEVLIDLCTGIPAQNVVQPFDFSCQFKNRVMLGGFTAGGEGNRMDFSIPNAPDVWNGQESSSNGTNSIYFGGVEPITTAVQLYNRFGANVFAMLLVFKAMEVYLLVGDSTEDFVVYPVSMVVGCPAPQTLAVTEISMEGGENFTRNFAVWLSHSGPMIFDGAVIAPLKGVENYFDPNHSDYINWDAIQTARGWVDLTYKEYNLLIPNGGSSTPNIWLTYDLTRRKWFKKSTGASNFPLSGWNAMDPATGEQFVYGGIATGYAMRLENGTSWDSAAMEYNIKSGDFWPSDNIWDYTVLRKYKLICKKINTNDNVTINLYYFNNTDFNSGQSLYCNDALLEFKDTLLTWAEAISVSFDLEVSAANQRVVQKTIDLNYKGWAHAFELRSSTVLTPQGFQPIAWGVQFRVERKDNKSNIGDQDV